jgi:hypothetical protein
MINLHFLNKKEFFVDENNVLITEEREKEYKSKGENPLVSHIFMGSYKCDTVIDLLKLIQNICVDEFKDVYIYDQSTLENFYFATRDDLSGYENLINKERSNRLKEILK